MIKLHIFYSGYTVYFIFALVYDAHNAIPLVALTCSIVAIVIYELIMKAFRSRLQLNAQLLRKHPHKDQFEKYNKIF